MKYLLILLLSIYTLKSWCQPAGYGFGKQILIQSSQVSGTSDLIDFPILVNFSDNDLRTTANGGNVEHMNGYDIIFTLGDCSTVLDHEIEDYNPSTGEYIAWVKIPTLGVSSNTNVHMYYGNSSVTTDPSTTNVWSNGFIGVWHMNQDPSGTAPQMNESTSNNFDGTSAGAMTNSDLINAKIGGGLDFDGSDDRITRTDNATLDVGTNDLTLSAWVYINNTLKSREIINKKAGGATENGYAIRIKNDVVEIAYKASGQSNLSTSSSTPIIISTSTWKYVAATFNVVGDSVVIHVNGVAEPTISIFAGNSIANEEDFSIGRRLTGARNNMDGRIDEVRVSTVARTTDWIATEYNNQNTPSTFYNISAEFTATNLCNILPIELIYFEARCGDNAIKLSWQTASEINNDYFTIERSVDAVNWEVLHEIDGAGNSSSLLNYESIDKNPFLGISYYRLKQTDDDGQYFYSQIKSVNFENKISSYTEIFPNPTHAQITIMGNSMELEQLKFYNALGQNVTNAIKIINNNKSILVLDLSNLKNGLYFFKTKATVKKVYKQ